jgi:sulfoxide reductase heme-binding subunit YedZ
LHWAWPWNDRQGRLSPLKLTTFLASFLPAIWLTDQVYEQNFGLFPLAGMTYWSGVWSMAFLLLALCVTPAAKVFRWPRLTILRRMVGVTALVYTIAHIIIYFALRMWDFVSIGNEMITRLSLIIATLSTIGIVALGVTSFVYVLTLMALIHYILSPGIYPSQYWMSGMFLWLMLWRWLDRQGRGTSIAMLFLLAIGTTLFTALFEAFWINIYQDFEFSSTLSNNFTLTFGISAAWKNLAVGLAVVVLALFAQARRPRHLPSSA